MAQQAGRSSVELYTSLFFKNKTEIEEGRVIRVLKNGFTVLIPKYGIESIVYSSQTVGGPSPLEYNDEDMCLVGPNDIKIRTFDSVKVEISVQGDEHGMRQKMNMKLIEPVIEGLSVEPSASGEKRENKEEDDRKTKKSKKN
jgi:exosome complex exonuclease DIS3/RRP44